MMKEYERRVFDATVANSAKATAIAGIWRRRSLGASVDVDMAAVAGMAAKGTHRTTLTSTAAAGAASGAARPACCCQPVRKYLTVSYKHAYLTSPASDKMSVSTRHTVKVEVKWDGMALSARPVLYPLEQDWLEARTVRGMLEYAVNDLDPSLFFELVEHIAVVVVEHELFSSPSSGKKRRRVTGESGGSRMLQDNLWEVMEEVPTRHFKFHVTLQEKFFGHKKEGKHGKEVMERLDASSREFGSAFNNTENVAWMERRKMSEVCVMLQDL
eukprot:jgi/Tetstr1/462544/TSEL_007532.t1